MGLSGTPHAAMATGSRREQLRCHAAACCRRQKLEAALRSKQKALEAARRKPDPLAKEPALRADVERLSAKAHDKVCPRGCAPPPVSVGCRATTVPVGTSSCVVFPCTRASPASLWFEDILSTR